MKETNYIKKKKNKEWEAIKDLIPYINEYLDIDIIPYNDKYENESPDFIFENGETRIGIEVIECHPSVKKNKKNNASALKSFQKRIIEMFKTNCFLNEITKETKLNIIINSGSELRINTKVEDVCRSLENHLRAWKECMRCNDQKLIRNIRVIETKGRNIIQFNNISSVYSINSKYLDDCIKKKNQKIELYKKYKCHEYWLCINVPFEENCQLDIIEDDKESLMDFNNTILECSFKKIFVSSDANKDILWLKK